MSKEISLQSDTKSSRSAAISVIIPVWNPGPGIDRCIDSLRNQTLKDIEMIFVDDRGSDNAMEKVKATAAEDTRIRILTNPRNLGEGPSRNAGIAAARGKYLSFIDPDDWLSDDFYELLYQAEQSEGADIAKGTDVYIKTDGSKAKRLMDLNRKIREGLKENIPMYVLFTYEHTTGLYRRELFVDTDVRYASTRRFPDTFFLNTVCTYAKTITFCDDALYYYCQRSDSAMNSIDYTALADQAKTFDEQMCWITSHLEGDDYLHDYVLMQVNGKLRVFYTLKKGIKYESDDIAFLNSLMETLRRYPELNELKKKSLPVRILMECQICLPDGVFTLSWDKHADIKTKRRLILDWIRFMSAHPRYYPAFLMHTAKRCGRKFKLLFGDCFGYS